MLWKRGPPEGNSGVVHARVALSLPGSRPLSARLKLRALSVYNPNPKLDKVRSIVSETLIQKQ